MKYHLFLRHMICSGIFTTLILMPYGLLYSQSLSISTGWHYLGHSKLNGAGMQVAFETRISNHVTIGLRSQIIHAEGERGFRYVEGERYTISDLEAPEKFYDLVSIPPGLIDREEFIATFKMRPARANQMSYGIFLAFRKEIGTGTFKMAFSPSLASVHKRYIVDSKKGTLTNLNGVFEEVNLVSVFVNDYLDASLSTQLSYALRNDHKFRPGIYLQVEYLATGYWNYGAGLTFNFGKK